MPKTCANCNETLEGDYCHHCGEKVVKESDFHLKTLLFQAVDGIFNVDSKAFRSFKYLLFKPGKLSTNYVNGIRKPFMKPIQVFLITNVLFFLLLTQADILRIPATYYFNTDRIEKLEKKSKTTGIETTKIKQEYDKKSTNISKTAIILTVPFLAFVLYILNFKTKSSFGVHMIFAMHFVSFFFVSCISAFLVSKFGNRAVQLFVVLLNLIYLIFAVKQFYRNTYVMAAVKAFVFLFIFYGVTIYYRKVISDFTFNFLI